MKAKTIIITSITLISIGIAGWKGYQYKQEQKTIELIHAIEINDTAEVHDILSSFFVDVNAVSKYSGTTPLIAAITQENKEMVAILLNNPEIDANHAGFNDLGISTPLALAAKIGNADIVKQLLATPGININKDGPIYIAEDYGHTEIVELLLNVPGIDLSHFSDKHLALIRNDNSEAFNSHYINNETCAKRNIDLLRSAASRGKIKIVKAIIKNSDFDVNKHINGTTTLHLVAKKGISNIMKLLLSVNGVDVNVRDEDMRTPLHIAALEGNTEIVNLLLNDPDLEVNATDKKGENPLRLAIQQGHTKIVRALLSHPYINVKAMTPNPAVLAFNLKHFEIYDLLINAGAKSIHER